ncbi:MAG: hypothetical protein AAFX94_18325, partial [Myxococcota bacterium]
MRRLLPVLALALVACGEDLKFNLIVYDSCAQFPLQSGQLDTLEVVVESPQLGQPVRQVFDFQARRGELVGVQPVDDAVVSVLVRAANGAGKSSLLKAIAGLWPYGRGRVTLPGGVE